MSIVDVTTYTDPACPFAYSAEPIRWRLSWRYGDQLRWSLRLVGLSKDGASYERMGFTPERAAASLRHFDQFGQPLATVASRPVGGTWSACRAIVAVREHDGVPAAVRLLRALHVQALALAQELGAEETIAAAAADAGIDAASLAAWREDPAVERAFEADLSAARRPSPAALALDGKLAPSGDDWTGDADGAVAPRRYTCPSYVVASDGRTLEAPGFHTALTIETLVANLAPQLDQRPWAEDPIEVLRWAGQPLTTQEVAAVLDLGEQRDEARERLVAGGAVERPAGNDALWTLA
ncbi:DsbA family protein [Patulibacter defluvii]|uniref:DsbA family protein n=1 Tax=Patulibacter defluvii TaxID=3095358 RepID=UPI002A748250|nr:DsbA family protein [Patulibacter sp. DM4]